MAAVHVLAARSLGSLHEMGSRYLSYTAAAAAAAAGSHSSDQDLRRLRRRL